MNRPDKLLGAVIDDRYAISARLARGGMATVYRARDRRLDRDVAIKFMHSHLAEQPEFVSRFNHEARAAAKLSSPFVVNVFDQGVTTTPDGRRAYLVMELVSGPDLRSELSRHGSLNLGAALEITRQVLSALAVAHDADLIHRDVKPENILMTEPLDAGHVFSKPSIHAKVADFGLARAVTTSTATQSNQVLGTVAYVAPELVTKGKSGAPADVYSTGIMLYELLAGRLPFTGETPLAVAYSQVNDAMPRLGELADWIPAGVDSLIGLFTAKDPDDRPANGRAALEALNALVGTLPEEALIRRVPVFPVAKSEATAVIGSADAGASDASAIPDGATSALEFPNATRVLTSALNNPISEGDAKPTKAAKGAARRRAKDAKAAQKSQRKAAAGAAATAGVAGTAVIGNELVRHNTPVAPGRKHRRWPVVVALLLFLAGAGAYATHWYFTQGPGLRVEIAKVAGLSETAAKAKLAEKGFTTSSTQAFSDDVEKGIVIGTDPGAGEFAHPSTKIELTVSKGIEHLVVPDVKNKTLADAQQALKDARFVPGSSEAYSETVAEGLVISQNPAAGESVPHDSPVEVVISKGREPIAVPDVRGQDIETATQRITDKGLLIVKTEAYSDTVSEGVVISQEPTASETLYKGDQVSLVVSKGPELVEVPNVFGKQQGEATQILEDAGFKVEIDAFLGGYFGTVRAQSPNAGEMLRRGSTVVLTVV